MLVSVSEVIPVLLVSYDAATLGNLRQNVLDQHNVLESRVSRKPRWPPKLENLGLVKTISQIILYSLQSKVIL